MHAPAGPIPIQFMGTDLAEDIPAAVQYLGEGIFDELAAQPVAAEYALNGGGVWALCAIRQKRCKPITKFSFDIVAGG